MLDWKLVLLELLRCCVDFQVWHICQELLRHIFTLLFSPCMLTLAPNSQVTCNSIVSFGNESMEAWKVHYSYSQSILDNSFWMIYIYLWYKIPKIQKGVHGVGGRGERCSFPLGAATQLHSWVTPLDMYMWLIYIVLHLDLVNVKYDLVTFHITFQRTLICFEEII